MSINVDQEKTQPTVVRQNVSVDPSGLNVNSEIDFNRFVFTGITVKVKVPFKQVNRNALFGINLDGFIPTFNFNDQPGNNYYASNFSNLFPVQPFYEARNIVEIFYDQSPLPILSKYLSYRVISGNVNVGIRVVSNVGQVGTFQITQATAVQRNFYGTSGKYKGLRFANSSISGSDYVSQGFVLFDVSTNRSVSITTAALNTNRTTDLMKKFVALKRDWKEPLVDFTDLYRNNNISSQFIENWLLVQPLGDFPASNGSEFSMCIYFDYSKVTFMLPFYTFIANSSTSATKQILDYTATFLEDKVINEITKTNSIFRVESASGIEETLAILLDEYMRITKFQNDLVPIPRELIKNFDPTLYEQFKTKYKEISENKIEVTTPK
jgi:hypothetical protein